MKITIAEAIKLKSLLSQKYNELTRERSSNATERVKTPSDTVDFPKRKVLDITNDIQEVLNDSAELSLLLAKANIENTVEFDGKEITLVSALDLVKVLRSEVVTLKRLGEAKDSQLRSDYSSEYYEILLYNPVPVLERSKELERKVNRLSNAINAKNFTTEIEVPFADTWM